jgi:hypothetical protein
MIALPRKRAPEPIEPDDFYRVNPIAGRPVARKLLAVKGSVGSEVPVTRACRDLGPHRSRGNVRRMLLRAESCYRDEGLVRLVVAVP